MDHLNTALQLVVAFSVFFVWIFRYPNVVAEFKQFGLSDTVRNAVGAFKISLAALLVVGIWYAPVVPVAAALMGVFMSAAQFFHWKAGNPIIKKTPSLILLLLSAWIAIGATP